jgi:hypothetical protein
MAVTAERVTVADAAAVALNTADTGGMTLHLVNGSAAVDLGGSDVASGEGLELAAAGTLTVAIKPGDVLFAIAGTGDSSDVQVLRT